MATSEPQLLQGWVLHRRPYRNTSLIVDCLSLEWGRFSAVLRGGRKNPLVQPFVPLWLLPSGKGELLTLQRVEPRAQAVILVGELLFCGLYVNELLTRLLGRFDPHPEVFTLYQQVLTALEQEQLPADVILREFEFHLLTELGYGFSLEYDAQGLPLQPAQQYRYVVERGLVASNQGFSGACLIQIGQRHWTDSNRQQAKNLLREVLRHHLGERPLHSRQLFRNRAQED